MILSHLSDDVLAALDLGAITRVVAYGPNQVLFSVTPDTFGDPTNGLGVLWAGSNPGPGLPIPAAGGQLTYWVGAPDAPEGYAAETDGGAGFDTLYLHRYAGGWSIPWQDSSVAWADPSDPVVWRGADPTHADSAVLAVRHFGGGACVIFEHNYSGGSGILTYHFSTLPGNYPEVGFSFRARLGGGPGNWWGTGTSRYGTGGFRDSIWIARFAEGGPSFAYGGPSSTENSAGVCLWVGSETDVWVGGFLDPGGSGGQRPWLWHTDGSTVTSLMAPSLPADSPGALQGIHGTSGSDLWAVGHVDDQTLGVDLMRQRILIYHYDGSTWTRVPGLDTLVPPVVGRQQVLYDVYARAADDVWAVGTVGYQSGVSAGRLLALHYDGVAWAVVPVTYTGV